MSHLSTAQLQTLKAAINANATWAAFPMTTDGYIGLAAALNAVASPDYWVIRTSISQMELQSKPDQDGGTFDWASTGGFIARSQGERDAWRSMFQPGNVNPSYAMVRQGFDDIFSGAGGQNTRAALLAIWKRSATRIEKILPVRFDGEKELNQPQLAMALVIVSHILTAIVVVFFAVALVFVWRSFYGMRIGSEAAK